MIMFRAFVQLHVKRSSWLAHIWLSKRNFRNVQKYDAVALYMQVRCQNINFILARCISKVNCTEKWQSQNTIASYNNHNATSC